MVVAGKYELAGVEAEAETWRTFRAREIGSGRAVLVHQLLGQPSLQDLAQRYGPVVDTCSGEGMEYVVTEAPPRGSGDERFTRVGAWRVPQGQPATPAPAGATDASASSVFSVPPAAEAPAAPEVQDEFARMFQTPAPAETPALPPPESPAPPAAQEPGSFTRMFQSPAAEPAQAPPPAPPRPATSQEPGDFTRMFQASGQGRAPASPSLPVRESPMAASEPGDFTRYFRSPLPSSPQGAAQPSAPPAAPSPAPPPVGEYTRLFQSPAPPPPTVAGSGATGAFLRPSAPPSAPLAPVEAGPSDYTRLMEARPQPAAQARPPEASPAPAPQPEPRKPGVAVWLIVLLSFLGVVAIGMILFFALRR